MKNYIKSFLYRRFLQIVSLWRNNPEPFHPNIQSHPAFTQIAPWSGSKPAGVTADYVGSFFVKDCLQERDLIPEESFKANYLPELPIE